MLRIFDERPVSRRALLTIGGLSFGGLTLPIGTSHGAALGSHLTGKSVIYLFQQGGPSQFETFDPKLEAPDGIRTLTDTVQTSLPGVIFGSHMRQLAKQAHRLTIVRSFQTGNGGHNLQPLVGPDSMDANIGVHYTRVAGATRPQSGVPTNIILYPASVAQGVPGPEARGDLSATGPYPRSYAPFVPGSGGQLQQDMTLSLPRERLFQDRQGLLAKLDRLQRRLDSRGEMQAHDDLQRQAYQVLSGGGVTKALDLSLEDPETIARYDTSKYEQKGRWNKVSRGQKGYYDANAACIGKLLLMARRLCEAGCGFVTIHAGYAGVWDMHADRNNLSMRDGMDAIGYSFDHAVTAFVEDLEARGLREKIMLVCAGEMGRTPKINERGGRDHWSKLAPLLMYGGGLRGGQVIGRSDRYGGEPATDNLTPQHLIATILNTVFDLGQLRLVPGVPDQVLQLSTRPQLPVDLRA